MPAKPLKHPPEQIPTGQRDADEGDADRQVLAKPGLEPEPREHDDLRGDGQTVADGDIRDRFDQRHDARLAHAAAWPDIEFLDQIQYRQENCRRRHAVTQGPGSFTVTGRCNTTPDERP